MKNKVLTVVALVTIMLSGCSSQFAYNNMDWLVHWYLDDYVDLNKQQKRLFDHKMASWLSWHKNEELLAYEQHLKQLQLDLNQPKMNDDLWSGHFNQARQHWVRLRDTLTPDLLELARGLSDEQVNDIFAQLAEETQERLEDHKDFAEKTEQEKQQIRTQDWFDEVSQWTGKLTDEQKGIISALVPEFQSTFIIGVEYRQRWQAEAKAVLLGREAANFDEKFNQLMSNPESLRTEEYQQKILDNRLIQNRLFGQLIPTLTPKQKKRVNKEIQELIEDMQELRED